MLAGHVGWKLREYGDDPLYWDVDETVVRCVMADPRLASIAEAERTRQAS